MWTIPNLISFARLLGVPLLVWLGFTGLADAWLFAVFVVSGVTDWLDGYLARKLNAFSELGAKLDPIADRLYILAALVVLLVRELVPVWVVLVVVARDLFMAGLLAVMRGRGFGPPAVHYIGKAGTMMLLWSIPLVFLARAEWVGQGVVRAFAFGFLAWGVVTYWAAGLMYLRQFLGLRDD